MFKKILIANRGEIACRITATARRLGVKTVAVFSSADSDAKHVHMADEAVFIGEPAVAKSYLRGERIIEAAQRTGAEAIHPGYGFLSENPDFVSAVTATGLVFIGPPASAIKAMGLKDHAKDLMTKAGVPVVPGYHGSNQEPSFLAEQALEIGYPVLIKARAGGGGKGMRLVTEPASFNAALESASSEAQTSFGDPACLIEKFISQPRHIEIQVFTDGHGNAVHLFERDCSLQRRHQKVIEEAPAPDMPEALREVMGKAAVDAACSIGYRGAGTVEFIADGSGPLRTGGFWFMEMNTRLQVEHPVSEAITGLDFVELQLRIASGEPLPFTQRDLSISGHAIEARLYAEDVAKGFLPATGRLDWLRFPLGCSEFEAGAVRIDSGVRQGDEISPWYDPMIAKLIVHGPTRQNALNRLTSALAECHIAGSVTNLEFLAALSKHEGFGRGQVDTGLIARDLATLIATPPTPPIVLALAALAALGLLDERNGDDPWERLAGWRHWTDAKQYVALDDQTNRYDQQVTALGHSQYEIVRSEPDGTSDRLQLTVAATGGSGYLMTQGQRRFRADVTRHHGRVAVFLDGRGYSFDLPDALATADTESGGGDAVIAPMPGLVKQIAVDVGANVTRGDPLMVLEAMKMEHTLAAPRDGVVAQVLARVNDQVTDGTLLLTLETSDS